MTLGTGFDILASMNNITWIFKDGVSEFKYASFPIAFRAMFNLVKKGVESGRKYNDMVKQMIIISPQKDAHGDPRRYSYATATQLAKDMDVLTIDGEINSRAFKKK